MRRERAFTQTPRRVPSGYRMTFERERLTAIDVFAGCGGSSVGFRSAGFSILAALDNDSVAAESYRRTLGIEPLVADVRRVTGRALLRRAGIKKGELTVLIGCPPCQGFTSHRRERRAGWDVRNRLLDEYVRLVDETRPRFIVFENVPGLERGRGRWRLARALTSLRQMGYSVASSVVDAADYGTPQFRKRLLVIGSRQHEIVELPAPTHGNPVSPEVRRGALRPWLTVRDAIGDLPRLRSGARAPSDPLHAARAHSETNLARMRAIPHDGGSRDALPKSLRLRCHDKHAGHYDVYGRMWWGRPAPTLTSGCTNITRGRFAHPTQDRAITVREALLLQGFPRYARVAGGIEQQSLQVGNAVPPPLAAAAARTVRRLVRKTARARANAPTRAQVAPRGPLPTAA